MPHTNDCIHSKLSAYPGTINDKLVAWLKASGASGDQINDLWHSLWDNATIPAGNFNDRMMAWLAAQTAVGSTYRDRYHDFWCRVYTPA